MNTSTDKSVMGQHESNEKYGGEDAPKEEQKYLNFSTQISTCPPVTKSDLESQDSPVICMRISGYRTVKEQHQHGQFTCVCSCMHGFQRKESAGREATTG